MGFLNAFAKFLFHIDINAILEENELLRNSLSEEQNASRKKDVRLSQMELETKSLRREVANLKSRKTLLEGDLSTLKYKLAESREDSVPDNNKYKYSIAQLEAWRIKSEEASKEIEGLRKELNNAHKEYVVVTKKLADIQMKYNSVKYELEALQYGQSTDLAELKSECRRLSDRLAGMSSERDRLAELIKIITDNRFAVSDEPLADKTPNSYKQLDVSSLSTQEALLGEFDKKTIVITSIIKALEFNAVDRELKKKKILEIISALQRAAQLIVSALSTNNITQTISESQNKNSKNQVREYAIQEMLHSDGGIKAFVEDGKWGFKFKSYVVTEPTYLVEPISKGSYYVVTNDGKFGLVDMFGELSLDVRFERIEILPNDSILYSDGEDWYLRGIADPLVDYNPNDDIQSSILSDKYLIYYLQIRKNQYIGQKLVEFFIIDSQIFKLDKNSNEWALWYSEEDDLNDHVKIEITDDNQLKLLRNDQVIYLSPDGTISEEGYIEEPEYLEQKPLPNGYYIVKLVDGYWGIVDDENNYAVLAQYNMICPINKKYLRFQAGDKWGVMNIEGDILIDAQYHSIESYCDGGFVVKKENPANHEEFIIEKLDL